MEGGESLILNPNNQVPIYIQIAEWIENEILADRLVTDGKVYSQYQLAEMFNINPATAGKGLTVLLESETSPHYNENTIELSPNAYVIFENM